MKSSIITGALAFALALGTTVAFAQNQTSQGPYIGDGHNSATPPDNYDIAGGAAKLGDGSNAKPAPGPYVDGTASAKQQPSKQ